MVSEDATLWNTLVASGGGLLLDDVIGVAGVETAERLFEGVDDLLQLKGSVFVTLPLGSGLNLGEPIQSVGLVVSHAYFDNSNQIKNIDVCSDLKIGGFNAKVSATEIARSLSCFDGSTELVTDNEGYKVIFGRALIFDCIPNGEYPIDPSDSMLGALIYNFGPNYDGSLSPVVQCLE